MSQNQPTAFRRDIQARDSTDVETAVRNVVRKKRERRQQQHDLDIEAHVRELLTLAKEAMANDAEVSGVLGEVHRLLLLDEDLDDVLSRGSDALEERTDLDADGAARVRAQFQRQKRLRGRPGRTPNPEREYPTLLYISQALGYYHSVTEMTPWAPVQLETLNEPGTKSAKNPLPVGRRRLPKDTRQSPEQAAVEIPHASCDHILCVALPRSGKDSTLASIGMNLYREHGYKYISVFDDGRMETPMLSIPNDDPGILKNLERMGQPPRAFDAEVFVPSTTSLPDHLPANFREFTIGIDSLTPNLVLRLANVNTSDATVEDRIEQALSATMNNSGTVPELTSRLEALSEQQDTTIQWSEKQDRHRDGGAEVETFTAYFQMDASKALQKAAARIAKLAGDGILAGSGAATNLDMESIIAEQEKAAVLCCNFMASGQEGLKYTIIDLWLRLVYHARDSNPRLPRVALELRELKNIAPSKPGDTRYKDEIKTLRQTIFFLSTNGGSRRILLLGSTQKLNDVYKPVRTNMATKILLRLGEEEIETLDRSYHFDFSIKKQLSEFQIGMGMLIAGGEYFWPIEWRGAPCGLGLGDQHWLDRYGRARGARVRQSVTAKWPPRGCEGDEWYVHVPDGEIRSVDESPDLGDFYSEWFLMESDFANAGVDVDPEEGVSHPAVEDALAARREHETPSKIHLRETESWSDRKLTMSNGEASKRQTVESLMVKHDIPAEARRMFVTEKDNMTESSMREKCHEVLRIVDAYDDLTSQSNIAEKASFSRTSLANYTGDGKPLGALLGKEGKQYVLTEAGEDLLDADWDVFVADLQEQL